MRPCMTRTPNRWANGHPCLVCRPWPAGVTSRCPACERSKPAGSYPLMNIASDFGVDYGDILIVSAWWRARRAFHEAWTVERDELAGAAWGRLRRSMRARDAEPLRLELDMHARRRWG